MAGITMDKWIEDVGVDDHTSDVARRALEERFAAVEHFLPLAAWHAEDDVEYVHELRVWSRRTNEALGLFAELLPRRRLAWAKKQLKRARRAANDARDFDVLLRRLAQEQAAPEVLAEVRRERAFAQRPIVALYKRFRRNHQFRRRLDELLRRVRPRGKNGAASGGQRFGDWARTSLRPIVENFFAAMPDDWTDEAAVHQLRIRGKELRYAMELLAGAFPAEFRDDLYPIVKTLQDKLGEIEDWATAQSRLQNRIEETSDSEEVQRLKLLLSDEEGRLARARAAFLQWCTPRRWDDLRLRFARLLTQHHLHADGAPM